MLIRIYSIFPLLLSLSLCLGMETEREALVKRCRTVYKQALSHFYCCDGTQIELTREAGLLWSKVEPLLCLAAEFRLRTAPAEELDILRDVYATGYEIGAVLNASKENTGSAESMHRYLRTSAIVKRQTEIFLAKPEMHALWQRIKSASGVLREHPFTLSNGKAMIHANCYGEFVILELLLKPDFCLTHNGSDYAVLVVDLPQSVNTDYLSVYLCKIDKQKLDVVRSLDAVHLERIEIKEKKLILHADKVLHEDTKPTIIDLSKL